MKKRRVKAPGPKASYDELADFFEKHDTVELLEQGIMEVDPDHSDLEAMLLGSRNNPTRSSSISALRNAPRK